MQERRLAPDEVDTLVAWHYETLRRFPAPPPWMRQLAQTGVPHALRGRTGRSHFLDRFWRRDWESPGWGFDYEGNTRFYAPARIRDLALEFRDPPTTAQLDSILFGNRE